MKTSVHPTWEITPEKVEAAIKKIAEVARPQIIIIFGSYDKKVRGRNSDVDFFVIVGDHVQNPRRESVRIREALSDILMPMDIVVVQDSTWTRVKDIPGLIYREAMKTGKVVYEKKLIK